MAANSYLRLNPHLQTVFQVFTTVCRAPHFRLTPFASRDAERQAGGDICAALSRPILNVGSDVHVHHVADLVESLDSHLARSLNSGLQDGSDVVWAGFQLAALGA